MMAFDSSSRTADEVVCVQLPASVDEVDEAGYLAANPDVCKAGVSARDHFAAYGRQEGRMQWINQDRVAEMREEKLGRVKFRTDPTVPRSRGAAANFLTPEIIAEFDIPDAPPVSANQYGGDFIADIRANPDKLCLDVGAGLRYTYASNIVNTEIYATISTDVVCVGEDLPFESEQFDYLICGDVLEHVLRPWQVADEICRVLKPGGKLLVDYPFLQGVHGYPHHYFNATPQGAVSLFEHACEIVESSIGPNNHPIQSIWWTLAAWRHGLQGADRERFEQLTIGDILATPPYEQLATPYCANLADEVKRIIPAGSTLIARKKSGPVERRDPARDVQSELAAMRASRSWRLTAPLRAVSRSLRQMASAK